MHSFILINGQWQGGGENNILAGAEEIETRYLKNVYPYQKVPIEGDSSLAVIHHIKGYESILKQTRSAWNLLQQVHPDTLLTIGGGCDADLASVSYLNQHYAGELTVFWFDAHGDMNTPEESPSGLFYGMPARMLMQPMYGFSPFVPVPVRTKNWIQVGGRELDPSEINFMKQNAILHAPTTEAGKIKEIIRKRRHGKAYIHFDLDVLDPAEFSSTPLHVAGGLPFKKIMELFEMIGSEMDLAGFGLYEYLPTHKKEPILDTVMDFVQQNILYCISPWQAEL